MSYVPIASYYANTGFNVSGTADSCWTVDSTYVANSAPLFQFGGGGCYDTFNSGSFFGGGFSNWFNWGGSSSGFSLKKGSKTKTSTSSLSRNGLLSVTDWDAHMRGKIKSVKRCNEDYISELQPKMQEKVRKLEAFAKSKGITFKICSGYRTPEKQQALRNKYGSRRAASVNGSPHRSGRAIDISTNGILTEAQCKMLGEYAESMGMRWGGRWGGPGSRTQRERWHFDLPA